MIEAGAPAPTLQTSEAGQEVISGDNRSVIPFPYEIDAKFATHAKLLADNGYVPLPLEPNSKAVLLSRWPTRTVEELLSLAGDHPNHGIGLRLGNGLAVVDADTTDPVLTDHLFRLAMMFIGGIVRVGAKGFAIPIRLTGVDRDWGGEDWTFGPEQTVQLLARGRQLAAFGTHPDTQGLYKWFYGHPLNTQVSDLPVCDLSYLRTFLKMAGGQPKASESSSVNRVRLTDFAPKGGRDNQLVKVAGHYARAVVHGELPLADALRRLEGWWAVQVEQVPGDTPTAQKAVEKLLELVRKDSEKVGGLPVGWDADLSEDLKAHMGGVNTRSKPIIELKDGKLPELVDKAEQALLQFPTGLYQWGDKLVKTSTCEADTFDGLKVQAMRLFPVTAAGLRETMMRSASFGQSSKTGWVEKNCPPDIANTYLARVGEWKLPRLTGLVCAPTLRPDGSILEVPGYDGDTGLLFEAGEVFDKVLSTPTRGDALKALSKLKGLLVGFPFVSDIDRSVALGLILTAVIRRSLPSAPLFGLTAPTAGTGKSYLVDITSHIVGGRAASVVNQGPREEETEKRLGALLLAGECFIAIDNCINPLGGEFLCSILTQTEAIVRILGKSEAPKLPTNATLVANGNNLRLVGDMCRRALLCQMDTGLERPELREFAFDPVELITADRSAYVGAALVVLRAYHEAGYPQQVKPVLGSFGDWSRRVRSALVWLGEADPVASQEQLRAEDPELTALGAVVEQWLEVLGDRRVTGRQATDEAVAPLHLYPIPGAPREYKHPDFREALLVVAGEGGSVNSKRLGKWLAEKEKRVIGGYSFVKDGVRGGSTVWRLMKRM